MSTPGELDPELQRRLQRYGATLDRAAADAQLARAAREAAGGVAGPATVSDLASRRRRVDWRVLATAAASVIVVAGAIGILLARGDGEPADRGVAASTGSGPTTLVEVAPDPVTTDDPATSTTVTTTTSATTTTVVATTAATTQPAVPVGPPPLALASTTTAPPGSEEARRPVCPSYTFRVEYSLRLCDKGPAVRIIQERLVAVGESISIDGYFGPGTEQAVRRFQGAHGLDVDGWVGPDTWRVLVPDAPGVDVDGNGVVDPPELAPS